MQRYAEELKSFENELLENKSQDDQDFQHESSSINNINLIEKNSSAFMDLGNLGRSRPSEDFDEDGILSPTNISP